MKKVFILVVMTLVLISGCVGQTNGGTGSAKYSGLEIKELTITPPNTVRAGGSVSINAIVENLGDSSVGANQALGRLIIPSDWNGGNTINDIAVATEIRAADPAVDRPAGTKSIKWNIAAPLLSAGQTRTDNIITRIYYEYQTDSNGVVYVYPYGEEAEEKTTFKTDNAPIELEVTTQPSEPVIEALTDTFTLNIKATNKGSGTPFVKGKIDNSTGNLLSIGSDEYNKLNIKVILPSGLTLNGGDCTTDSAGTALFLYGEPKSGTMQCDLKVSTVPASKKPFSITVKARYGYYTEDSQQIEITGKN